MKNEARTRVYCGPSVRGVARQYTSFSGELPESMKRFIEQHPMAESLIVPYDKCRKPVRGWNSPKFRASPRRQNGSFMSSSKQSCKEDKRWHIVMAYM